MVKWGINTPFSTCAKNEVSYDYSYKQHWGIENQLHWVLDTVIELTYNWGVSEYDLGKGYGHIALGVDDIYGTCDRIKAQGGKVSREPGPMKHGSTVIAFVEDPDGYKIELIQLGTQGSAKKQ